MRLPSNTATAALFSKHLVALLKRLVHERFQIEIMDLPTSLTAIFPGTFTGNNNVEMLSALIAVNHHFDWVTEQVVPFLYYNGEVPSHKCVVLPPDDSNPATVEHGGIELQSEISNLIAQ